MKNNQETSSSVIMSLIRHKNNIAVCNDIDEMLCGLEGTYLEEKRRRPGGGNPQQQQQHNRQNQPKHNRQDKYHELRKTFEHLQTLDYHHNFEKPSEEGTKIEKMLHRFRKAVRHLAKGHASEEGSTAQEIFTSAGESQMESIKQDLKAHMKKHGLDDNKMRQMREKNEKHKRYIGHNEGPASIMRSEQSKHNMSESIIHGIETKNFVEAKNMIQQTLTNKSLEFFESVNPMIINSIFNESNDPIGSLIKILNRGDLNPGAPKTTPPLPTKKPLSVKMKSVATTNKPKKLRLPDPKDYDKALY